jgi:hypothetical protein
MAEETSHREKCIEGNSLRAILKRYGRYLDDRGYSALTCREYVSVAAHFGRWLGRRGAVFVKPDGGPAIQTSAHTDVSVSGTRDPKCDTCSLGVGASVGDVRYSRDACCRIPSCFVGDLLRRCEERLVKVQGLAAGTVQYRLTHAQRMLSGLRVKHPAQLAKWTPQRIASWLSSEVEGFQRSTAQNIAVSARSLLRFVLQEGPVHRDLSAAVPTFAHWRLAPLPETLQKKELVQLIRVADVRTAVGLRD